jgi:hypothetical protein
MASNTASAPPAPQYAGLHAVKRPRASSRTRMQCRVQRCSHRCPPRAWPSSCASAARSWSTVHACSRPTPSASTRRRLPFTRTEAMPSMQSGLNQISSTLRVRVVVASSCSSWPRTGSSRGSIRTTSSEGWLSVSTSCASSSLRGRKRQRPKAPTYAKEPASVRGMRRRMRSVMRTWNPAAAAMPSAMSSAGHTSDSATASTTVHPKNASASSARRGKAKRDTALS